MNTSIINTYILLSLIILFIIPVVECRRRRLQSYKSRSSRLPILPIVDPSSPDDQQSSQNNNIIVPTPSPSYYSYNVDSLPASTSTSTSPTTDEITTDSLPVSALHSKIASTLMHHHRHSSTTTIETTTNELSSSLGYHTPTLQPSTSDHSLKDHTTIPTSSNPSSAQLLRLSERLSFSPLHSEKNGDNISFSDNKVHCSNTEVEFTEPHRSIELPYYYQIETEYDVNDAFLQMIESSVLSALADILTCTNGDVDEEDEDIRRLLSEGMQKQQGTRVIAVYSYQVDRNECKLLLMQ